MQLRRAPNRADGAQARERRCPHRHRASLTEEKRGDGLERRSSTGIARERETSADDAAPCQREYCTTFSCRQGERADPFMGVPCVGRSHGQAGRSHGQTDRSHGQTAASHGQLVGAMVKLPQAMVKRLRAMVKCRIPAFAGRITKSLASSADPARVGEFRPFSAFSASNRQFHPACSGLPVRVFEFRSALGSKGGSDCRELRSTARKSPASHGQFGEPWSNRPSSGRFVPAPSEPSNPGSTTPSRKSSRVSRADWRSNSRASQRASE